ncbi:fumarylacetoacetate hydrolase family protein [Roseomonas elaeocarpi]|uniref:Fumarylacetoacetate hydrolase family protein n=1 Tax=Roseomonas elaeocarpi TaxID=907779 RepID=A0ABV6K0D0_9PROT
MLLDDDAAFPAEEAAAFLHALRRDGRTVATLPEMLQPRSLAQAYAVQDAALRRLGPVGGWKVGPPKPDGQIFCAPVPQSLVFHAPAALPVLAPSLEAEVEVGLVLGRDLVAADAGLEPAALRAAVATVHVAVELLASRFRDRRAVDSLLPLADAQSNAAIVLGPALGDGALLAFEQLDAALWIDGQPAGSSRRGPSGAAILRSLAWLIGHAAERGVALRAGQALVTGARVGPVPVPHGALLEAELSPGGRMSLRLPALQGAG